ncbi:MAG TPA: hypothetical protein VIN08_08065 [Ohtaekwangia sp.]|uniref:hypothetical protein n=1 Tax=Ohtaekwangia sp. TaxID=2066019 RepID=UPI002F948C6B
MESPFEYVTVLISIVLGMGITQLVSGFAAIVIKWERVKIYWPHMILILLVFIIHIQDWWATYELHAYEYWRLPTFLFIILYPVNLYILARILFPPRWAAKEIDLKKFYFENYRKIYLFMIFLPVHSIIENIFIGGYSINDQVVQIFLLMILVPVAALNRKDEWMHKAIAIIFLLIMVVTFAVAWNIFLIKK